MEQQHKTDNRLQCQCGKKFDRWRAKCPSCYEALLDELERLRLLEASWRSKYEKLSQETGVDYEVKSDRAREPKYFVKNGERKKIE